VGAWEEAATALLLWALGEGDDVFKVEAAASLLLWGHGRWRGRRLVVRGR
jgi:hypothetical protein